jgi:hypothetical protein
MNVERLHWVAQFVWSELESGAGTGYSRAQRRSCV